MANPWFTPLSVRLQHLVKPGSGLKGEIYDLRQDVEAALTAVEGDYGLYLRTIRTVTPTGTDDTANVAAAITAMAAVGGRVVFKGATYYIDTIAITGSLTLQLDDATILKHKSSASGHMFVFSGTLLHIIGGVIDGNQAGQTSGTHYAISAAIPSTARVIVEDTRFINTATAAIGVTNFGGLLDVQRCRFTNMREHDGVLNHDTCAINVSSGEPGMKGLFRFSYNTLIGTITPSNEGGSPGGVFFAPTLNLATGSGNYSSIEAIGNWFYGIGQNCGGNDIACIHCYPTTDGLRAIGNYMEGCGFSAIAAKSVRNAIISNNVIRNGQTSAQNDPTSGAIYYTMDHADSVQNPRAVIAHNIIDTPGGTATTKQNGISAIGIPTSTMQDFVIDGNVINGCGVAIWIDRAVSGTITNNLIVGGTGAASPGEDGIEFNHVTGRMAVRGNHLTMANGYGLCATNRNETASFLVSDNLVVHTAAGTSAAIFRGVGSVDFKDNTFDSTATAVDVTTDGTYDVGALGYDPGNVILSGGLKTIDETYVTKRIGVVDVADLLPRQITGVTGYWDTAYGVTQASALCSAWADSIGAYTFAQATGGNKPAVVQNVFNRRTALRFNGTSSYMTVATTLATLFAAGTAWIYIVYRPITVSRAVAAQYDNDGVLMDTNGVMGLAAKSGVGLLSFNSDGSYANNTLALTLGKPLIVTMRHTGGNISIRKGNSAYSANVASGNTTALTGQMRLGAGYDNAHYANFDVGAIVTMNTAPSATDDYRILRWAAQEFGVTL